MDTPAFECPRCGFLTSTRAYLLKHIDKKITCPPTKEAVTKEEIKQRLGLRASKSYNRDTQTYDCNICHKSFQSASGKYKHLKMCKVQEPIDEPVNLSGLELERLGMGFAIGLCAASALFKK